MAQHERLDIEDGSAVEGMLRVFIAATFFLGGLLPESTPAVEKFTKLRESEKAAAKAGDVHARLEYALQIQKLLNNAPDAMEESAAAYAAAGEAHHALTNLRRFAEMGQVDDDLLRTENEIFASLKNLPEYENVLKHFVRNKTAISHAEVAFTLPDPGVLPEDIDYEPQSGSFFMTSVLKAKIMHVNVHGEASDFALAPDHWPVLAIKVDSARKRVWATEVALEGFAVFPKSDWGRSAVLCFDLSTGKLLNRIEGPANSVLGDMFLASDGKPIVSDGNGGGIYRVCDNRLKRIDHADFISPQTPAIDADGRHIFIPDYARGIGVLNLSTGKVRWLNIEGRYATNGIDGLYSERDSLIATQNGTSPERVVRWHLDSSHTNILSEEIIERATPTLGDPTHGVIVGDFFYYIANSGWSVLDEHGDVKKGARLTPARIMRYRVR